MMIDIGVVGLGLSAGFCALGAVLAVAHAVAQVLPRRRQASRDRAAVRATWSRSRNGGL